MGNDKLEVVIEFCYLGDIFSAANFFQSLDANLLGVSFMNFSPILIYFSKPEVKFKTRTSYL